MKKLLLICPLISTIAYGIEYDINVDLISQCQEHSQTTYIGGAIDAAINLKFNDDLGCYTNIVIDKRCISDRLSEINAAYLYYIFDYAGEIHVGYDLPVDQSICLIPREWYENRSYAINKNLAKYNKTDDHSTLRVTWISPKIKGIKIIGSYLPNSSICRGKNPYYTKHLVSCGISYEGGFHEKISYGISCLLHVGKSYYHDLHHPKSYCIESYLGYGNLVINNRLICDGTSQQKLNGDHLDTSCETNLVYKIKKNTQIAVGYYISHEADGIRRITKTSLQHKWKKYDAYIEYKRLPKAHNISVGIRRRITVQG